ncbi:MAG: D-alanyl-D-alanine carboxypeptidase [Firmicutes bacterium]|nr:D-alanyl-D-alanine carboxypeptidase [Bacillota bacterium]
MKLKRKVREARINKREAKSKDPQAGAGDIRAKLSGARKKIFISVLGCAVILCAFVGIGRNLPKQDPIELETVSDEAPAEEDKAPFEVAAKGAVLIDADTGKVLFQQNAHEELPLASVTKVMTMLLVMDSVDAGKISLDDEVTISERAASMGGSQMYMEVGETHTVQELLKGVAMASANDGCVALAEYVAGSEEIFVERMNEKAKELGMRDSHFVNTNGLPVAEHYSSAYDISIMSKELYKYEETRKWFTTWQDTITVGLPGKEKEFGLTNTNKLIKQYQGCDGIKTGFTSDAGYCLSASATRGDTHLIAVALGCETSDIRNQEVSKILDYGFANYETHIVAEKGEALEKITVERGNPQKVEAVADERITALVEKGGAGNITTKVKLEDKVSLPLVKGDEMGVLEVYQNEEKIAEYSLVAAGDVNKASFRQMVSRFFKKIF